MNDTITPRSTEQAITLGRRVAGDERRIRELESLRAQAEHAGRTLMEHGFNDKAMQAATLAGFYREAIEAAREPQEVMA